MKTRLPAIPRNESQHLLHMLMVSVSAAISDEAATIRIVDATFRLETLIAPKQLIA
jgi:hypothetical protein